MKALPWGIALLGFLSLACGPSDEDRQHLVDTAVELTERADQLRADRDAALANFEDAWADVERGPQIALRAMERVADGLESRGMTIDARRMKEDTLAKFEADPLVQHANRLAGIYRGRDASTY